MGFQPFGDTGFTKPEEVPTLPIAPTHVVSSLASGILMLKSLKSINQFSLSCQLQSFSPLA